MSEINFNIFFNGAENTQSGTESNPNPDENPTPIPNNPTQVHGGIKQIAGIATMIQIGKSALNYGKSHVQMYTGSSDMQDKVNAASGLIGTGLAIAANPYLGIAMAAFNLATKAMEYAQKQKEENISLTQLRSRAGPTLNHSRY